MFLTILTNSSHQNALDQGIPEVKLIIRPFSLVVLRSRGPAQQLLGQSKGSNTQPTYYKKCYYCSSVHDLPLTWTSLKATIHAIQGHLSHANIPYRNQRQPRKRTFCVISMCMQFKQHGGEILLPLEDYTVYVMWHNNWATRSIDRTWLAQTSLIRHNLISQYVSSTLLDRNVGSMHSLQKFGANLQLCNKVFTIPLTTNNEASESWLIQYSVAC